MSEMVRRKISVCLIVAFLFAFGPALTTARAESSSNADGAKISLGVFGAVIVVLFWLGMKSDMEKNVKADESLQLAGSKPGEKMALVVKPLPPPVLGNFADAAPFDPNIGVGVRMTF